MNKLEKIEFAKFSVIKDCPNSDDGIHRGISHKDFGDGCCTCGKYMIFDQDMPLLSKEEIIENHKEDYEQFKGSILGGKDNV